ncbi:ER membrane glycoprotein subunit of the GPI transamidase complex-like protein, partial [Serendipita sp. 401]
MSAYGGLTPSKVNLRNLFLGHTLYKILCILILLACSQLPAFDSAHNVNWPTSREDTIFKQFITTTIRWDTFHFLNIAQNGYSYEHLYAFFPGVPAILRVTSVLFGYGAYESMLWGSWISIMFCVTTKTLYELTLLESGSQQVAMLATACSLLVTSPAAQLHAPYAEPFFTFLSYKGLLQCAHKNWLRASLYFMLACCFRSNGALLVGYIVWGMIIEPLQYP